MQLILYWAIHKTMESFFKYICRWQVFGRDNLPQSGPVIIISNHVGSWDPLALGIAMNRQVCYMAKKELFDIPLLGFIIKCLGAFPVKRGGGDRYVLKAAQQILHEGKVIGIFPEGSRSKTGQLQPFKAGAAVLAYRTGSPILPVGLIDTKNIFRKGWFRTFKVNIGQPIFVEKREIIETEQVEDLLKILQQRIQELINV
jgi:1-acyl-sn-glycerol-3-phosphate acyltransferase